MDVYVLHFEEWGWEEDEEQSGTVLGVYETEPEAIKAKYEAKLNNSHGDYTIKKMKVGKFYRYGA
jgi:hypothetical protein